LQVFPIAGAVDVAKAASAQLIIVNNQATQYDDVADGVLRDSINEVIPLILGT
jgi:NAD-dependent deacetylase